MVTIKTRSGSAYKTLRTLFDNDFEPEKGYSMKIPLIGNHATINHELIYWDWHSVHEENPEEAILEVYSNGIEIRVNGHLRAMISPKHLKRLWISVQGGLFQKDNYTESYYLYFGAEEKDFYQSLSLFFIFLSCP